MSGTTAAYAPAGAAITAGLAVVGLGLGLVYRFSRRIVFQRATGFWSGRGKRPTGRVVPLAHIHALQLISEVATDSRSYVSWELNVVLESGERINVLDHADWLALRADAERLAKFLRVPLRKGV